MTSRNSSSSSSKHGKSRPASLAQMHLAVLKHMERCRESGTQLGFDPDAVRTILQDQSGSKANHAPRARNPCEERDPLRHILSASTACGAGSDPSVFRPDDQHFGVRMYPELRLAPFLSELEALQRAWQGTHESAPESDEMLAHLRAPSGSAHHPARHAPARPLW